MDALRTIPSGMLLVGEERGFDFPAMLLYPPFAFGLVPYMPEGGRL